MAAYEIFFRESVWKELKKVPKADLKKILSRIEQLGNDPRPMGCEKLTECPSKAITAWKT
jgi:mRNA interferase RelE/StbE